MKFLRRGGKSCIQNIKGSEFVRNWDRGLIRAVAETNLLNPHMG